jgi:hypothetical protein
MVKPGQRWSNLVKDGQIWSKMVKHGHFQIFGEFYGQSSPGKIQYAKVYLENLNFMSDNRNFFGSRPRRLQPSLSCKLLAYVHLV